MNTFDEKSRKAEIGFNIILLMLYLTMVVCAFISGGICSYPLHENYFDISVLNVFAFVSFLLMIFWNVGNAILQLFVRNRKYHTLSIVVSMVLLLIQFVFIALSIILHPAESMIMVYVVIFFLAFIFEIIKLILSIERLKNKDNL